ncbi:MAG: hypothetical protein JSV25_03130 [Spirochaetota bacterium]|nr:MAG: hypothetical protein JSV25_03130 [Spirochaetota bacterium]
MKNEPLHLLHKKLIQRRGLGRILGNWFLLPLNREKKWEAFIKLTDHLVPEPTYRIKYPRDRCAVIVELRKHPHLSYILRNIVYFLDESWGLHIFHGNENEQFVKQIVHGWGDVVLTNLIKNKYTKEDYSKLLTSKGFWKDIGSEHILIFQTDSILRKRGIEEFLHWDYVGAPWKSDDTPQIGGNGGFSLRRRSVMLDILENDKSNIPKEPEDIFFCMKLSEGNYNVAPLEVAVRFSVEEIFYPDPVGTHIPRQLCNSRQINTILLGVRYGM